MEKYGKNWFFIGALIILFLMAVIYSIFYWRRKKNNFRNLTIKKQINTMLMIALLSATGITIVLLLNKVTPLMIIPSTRIAFEGIFVKLGGLIFGPIIGIAIAIIIEFIVLTTIPTYFHFYYFLVLVSFGFVSGMIKFLINKVKKTQWQFIIIYISLIVFTMFNLFYLYWYSKFNFAQISFKEILLILNFVSFFMLLTGIIFLNSTMIDEKIHWKWINEKNVKNFITILLLAIFTEYIVSICIATEANRSVFGESNNSLYVLLNAAILIAPLKIIFNTFIIYQSWKTMNSYLKFSKVF